MKYKLVCSDLDGSLLDWNGEIVPENLKAIQALEEEGVLFAICTGRLLSGANLIAKRNGIAPYIICLCGAVVEEPGFGAILRRECMDPEAMDIILGISEEFGAISTSFNILNDMITNNEVDTYESKVYRELNERMPEEDQKVGITLGASREELESISGEVCKVLMWFEDAKECRAAYRALAGTPLFEIDGGFPTNLEFTKKGITKWNGIESIMEKYDIKPEEVVCIGDGMNDIDMIRHAGLGVAMANAQEEVKEAADIITDTNVNAGVAKIIYACLRGEYD